MQEFTDILDELKIPYANPGQHHHTRTGWIQLDCPYCGRDSHNFHLGYNLSGNFLNCWKCGPHPLIATVAELASVSPYKAAGLLKHIKTQVREERRLWGKLEVPTGILDYLPKVHRQYLIKRGFNPNEIGTLWGVTGIGIHPDLAWRLFIPIYYKGDIVSWTTRLITDTTNEIRYRSAKETQERIPHKQLLYGEDYVRTSVIVHEGPTDVWKTGPGAVCTFGTGYKQTQITRLIKYPKRVICFDNEPTAQQRAKKLMNDLSCFPGETCNVLLDAKDAGSATEHEIKQLRKLLK